MLEYAEVYLLENPYCIDRAFDYFIPPHLRESIQPGDLVSVPFGTANRKQIGLISALKSETSNPQDRCKPVFSVCDRKLSLNREMLGLCFFMKEQTLCTMGDAVHTMIPATALSRLEEFYAPSDSLSEDANLYSLDASTLLVCDFIRKKGSVRFDLLKKKFGPGVEEPLKTLLAQKRIVKDIFIRQPEEKQESFCRLAVSKEYAARIVEKKEPNLPLRSAKQIAVLQHLLNIDQEEYPEKALYDACQVTVTQINALCNKGLLCRVRRPIERKQKFTEQTPAPILNQEQGAAYETLCRLSDSETAQAALLHGVTGSGKTAVMMKTIDHVLKKQKGVILLLPEIALTPQTLDRFCSRYGERVAILHSGLSVGERMSTYQRIREGHADVVIGTRSAVFAPLQNLGLIILDEEQEHTYKSDMNPKYHAKDIARYRCAYHKALMLLASATPSLESYHKALEGSYTLLSLKSRYGKASLPKVTIADMRQDPAGGSSPLGQLLCTRLVENQSQQNQSVLFLNRRGYNNFVSCRSCGEAIRCPTCSVSMTYHTTGNAYEKGELRCHWCGRRQPLPSACPSCGSEHLVRMGFGTQRVEQELKDLLPDAKILRMDTDTTASRYAYEEMLGTFRRHDADILLGTQMVTKGHDFPDVTLVGVLSADASLYLDDYRAAERTFAMLTQVIGRAGRADKPGEAVIQTNNPDHECIQLACAQDYERFYQNEIRLRKLLIFPPFCDIVLLMLTSPDEPELCKASQILAQTLGELLKKQYADVPMISYGPFEAPVYKVESKYRMRMIIKCRLNKQSRKLFSELLAFFSRSAPQKITLSIDFNPSSL